MWKNIASFVLGAAIGGAAVYFATKSDFEQREQEFVDALKKDYKEYYERREKESVHEAEVALAKKLNAEKEAMAGQIFGNNETESNETEDIPEEPEEPRSSNLTEEDYIDYGKMYVENSLRKDIRSDREELGTTTPFYNAWAEEVEKVLSEDDGLEDYEFGDDEWPSDSTDIKYEQAGTEDTDVEDDNDSDYIPDYDHPEESPNPEPYAISRREFANGKLYFDKTDLEYYEEDNVLVDPYTDEIMDDLKNSVGDGFTIEFDKEDPDMAYIRNDNTGSDYSIRRIHAKYYSDVEED